MKKILAAAILLTFAAVPLQAQTDATLGFGAFSPMLAESMVPLVGALTSIVAIVAAIVQAHGGVIKVNSELNRGTCFRLLFKQIIPTS